MFVTPMTSHFGDCVHTVTDLHSYSVLYIITLCSTHDVSYAFTMCCTHCVICTLTVFTHLLPFTQLLCAVCTVFYAFTV